MTTEAPTAYSAGERVMTVDYSIYNGLTGTVIGYDPSGTFVEVQMDPGMIDRITEWNGDGIPAYAGSPSGVYRFQHDEIQKIPSVLEFLPGDRIKVLLYNGVQRHKNMTFTGLTGTVVHIPGYPAPFEYVRVKLDDQDKLSHLEWIIGTDGLARFYPNEIVKLPRSGVEESEQPV